DLNYECRLYEVDLVEEPEIIAPWDPIPPELQWVGCNSPWESILIGEEGLTRFEVRAVDRNDNVDPTPFIKDIWPAEEPPETIIVEHPPAVTNSRSATFTFTAIDPFTPPMFMEYECRLDTKDPDMWLECLNPTIFSNLGSGPHTIEVRAESGGSELVDPTPARFSWIVGQGSNCDTANITLTATADGWVNEVVPWENYLFETELSVSSDATGDPDAVPPVPTIGQNARSLFRFDLPTDAAHCRLESATLRLFNDGPEGAEGTDNPRTILATPLAGTFKESTLTWMSQPGTWPNQPGTTSDDPVAAFPPLAEGYMGWNVLSHVEAMLAGDLPNYGWQIKDAHESDLENGAEQSFGSREVFQEPPPEPGTLPELVLRYADDDPTVPPAPPEPDMGNPVELECGQVITESTLLADDVSGCLGEGLIIGAPNIVLDLGGHTVSSDAVFIAGQEDGLISGIRNSGKSNVVIRNGTVKNFGYGVMLTGGTTFNVVHDLRLEGHILAGMELNDADDGRNGNIIRNNVFTGNGEAALSLINHTEGTLVKDNYFFSNGGVGFQLIEADRNRFEGNEMLGISFNPNIDSDAGANLAFSTENEFVDNYFSDFGDAGFVITESSHRNLVEGNTMVRNGDAGVYIQDSAGTRVIDNLAHGSSDGGVVINQGNDTVVIGNDVRYNPNGVDSGNSNNVWIEDNDASHSLQSGFELGNGVNLIVRNNVANLTGGAGISIESAFFNVLGQPVGGALIEGNTTNENRESGLTVADGGHTVRNNTAHSNAGVGIEIGENPELPGEPYSHTNIAPPLGHPLVYKASGNGRGSPLDPIEPGDEQCVGLECLGGGAPPFTLEDAVAPDTQFLTGPGGPVSGGQTSETSATFTFTGTDDTTPATAMTFECRVDAPPDPTIPPDPDPEPPHPNEPPDIDTIDFGVWLECASPFHIPMLSQGPHHLEVRALDNMENQDMTPARWEWEIDITLPDELAGDDELPPDTFISAGPMGAIDSTGATFRFTGSDNLIPGPYLTFECRLDGEPVGFEECTTPKTYSNLDPGEHTFEVAAIDLKGNVDPTPASRTWTINPPQADVTPPDTAIDSHPDPTTVLTTATFTFSSEDPSATFECKLDLPAPNNDWEPCTSPEEYTGIQTGIRTFEVRARDLAGWYDPSPAKFSWNVGSAPVPGFIFCGQVVRTSIKAKNDLGDCLWDGLVIGADNITIDLDGHTIDGKGVAAGIRNDGYDNVTIKNGKILEFDWGVMLNPGPEMNIVERLEIQQGQEAGIGLGHVPHPTDMLLPLPPPPPSSFDSKVFGNIIRFNDIVSNDVGIWLAFQTKETLILENEINVNPSGGVVLERSHGNRIERNTIFG
ncbi:MAG TPA: right-handed parallel beta-helix repeat-containing protein, partial [Actinomycetota bacterium]|nr:right-handed parallel beta-helix repeat-containing protein [Actinomycetota bacterium]